MEKLWTIISDSWFTGNKIFIWTDAIRFILSISISIHTHMVSVVIIHHLNILSDTYSQRATKGSPKKREHELFILHCGLVLSSLSFPCISVLHFYSSFLYNWLSMTVTETVCPPNEIRNGSEQNRWTSLKVDVSTRSYTLLSWADRDRRLLMSPGKLIGWAREEGMSGGVFYGTNSEQHAA